MIKNRLIAVAAAFALFAASAPSLSQGVTFPGPGAAGTCLKTPNSIGTGFNNTNPATTGTITTTAAIPSGALVIVGLSVNSLNNVTHASVSDGTNSYTLAGTNATTTNTSFAIFYKINAAAVASGSTITDTFSGTTGAVANFSGVAISFTNCANATIDAFAKTSSNSANSLSIATGTLSQAREIIIGFTGIQGGTGAYSGASGFTNVNSVPANLGAEPGSALDYQYVSATTTVTFAPAWAGAVGRMGAIVASFSY